MSIGSITSTGKQNVAGALKYKKLQKGDKSLCFLANDSVIDFASLVSFIISHGGSSILTQETTTFKTSAIPAANGFNSSTTTNLYSYTSLIVEQSQTTGDTEWSTPTTIMAVGYHSTTGNPYDRMTIDNTWTVVDVD